MIQDFSREELEPVAANNDAEFTLGIGTILTLGGALLLVCGICFAFGYVVGHRTSAGQITASVLPNSKSTAYPAGSGAKPGPGAQATPSAPMPVATDGSDEKSAPSTQSSSTAVASGVPSAQSESGLAGNPGVKPALGTSTDSAVRIQPATAQVQGWMVQIAAVSRAEDADVLVSALRKRGYAVSARHAIGDNLIHVQTGPFVSRNDANAMRQKLLNDGYNAIIE
jgi:DedD protein